MIKILAVMLCFISTVVYAGSPERVQAVHKWNEFVFKSNLQINLHHFLFELARDEKYFEYELKNKNLTQKEILNLKDAVKQYKIKIDGGHILFDEGEIPQMTSDVLTRRDINFDTSIGKAFTSFIPVYERVYWSKHDSKNKKWVEELGSKLDQYGRQIAGKLEVLFQSELVTKEQHLIDVVYKPGIKQGAYTSTRNSQTIINSTSEDFLNWYALEMIFHEVSHAVSVNRESKLQSLIKSVFEKNGLESETGIWHPILFYTVGEVVKNAIDVQKQNYVPYALLNDLYKGRWSYENILIEYWKPYIEGKVTMEVAVENIAKELLVRNKNA